MKLTTDSSFGSWALYHLHRRQHMYLVLYRVTEAPDDENVVNGARDYIVWFMRGMYPRHTYEQ